MGMFSEIASEAVIKEIIKHIDIELQARPHPEAQEALKAVARKALCEFDWSTPEWAKSLADRYKAAPNPSA